MISAKEKVASLWSDFDNTAVELARKSTLRGWTNYPLSGIHGYGDFLQGVESSGVNIAGIVSRRLNTFLNRRVTMRTIGDIGLSDFFRERQIKLLNHEDRKARHIVEQGCSNVVGLIDDRPHRIGTAILRSLNTLQVDGEPSQIVLGAVTHRKTDEYIDRFVEHATHLGLEFTETGSAYTLQADRAQISIVKLGAYSFQSGRDFADYLIQD